MQRLREQPAAFIRMQARCIPAGQQHPSAGRAIIANGASQPVRRRATIQRADALKVPLSYFPFFFVAKPRTSFFTRLSICSFVSFLPNGGMSSPPSVTCLINAASDFEA